jgi:hypothetical protein
MVIRAVVITIVFVLLELGARTIVAQQAMQMSTLPMLAAFGKSAANDSTLRAARDLEFKWKSLGDYLVPEDYQSTDFNFREGFRVTVGQPTTYSSTVWLVGPSNVVAVEIADKDTVASAMQVLMPTVRVVNVGIYGATTAQLESRIKALPLEKNDVVILLAGSIESYNVWSRADEDRGTRITDGICNILLHNVRLAMVTLACWQEQYNVPGLYDNRIVGYANSEYTTYHRAVDNIASYLSGRKLRFINALAPFCLCTYLADYRGIERGFEAFALLARDDETILDLSHLVPEKDFFTFAHINAAGSKLVAEALVTTINNANQPPD